MKRNYPKNRKSGSGRPLPKATEHKLDCEFCGGMQDVNLINQFYNKYKKDFGLTIISYTCDHCCRSLRIYRSVSGFYRVQKSIDKRKKWAKQYLENERSI